MTNQHPLPGLADGLRGVVEGFADRFDPLRTHAHVRVEVLGQRGERRDAAEDAAAAAAVSTFNRWVG